MPSPSETLLCQYRYDPLDRLVANALPDEPERQRFYCKSRLANEIHGAIGYSIVQHEDQLLAQQRSEGDARETALLAMDQQRSVLHSRKANQPQQRFAYSPYGHRRTANGLLTLLGFNGERQDPVTGCYSLGNGHRTFCPVLMRFIIPDTLSPFGKGGINAYGYCQGNPISRNDPSGQFTVAAFASALKTRTASIAKYGGPVPIRPGVSTTKAMRARDKILKINNELDQYDDMRRIEGEKAYKNNFPLNEPDSLRNMAADAVSKHSLVPEAPGLRTVVKNRLVSRDEHLKSVKNLKDFGVDPWRAVSRFDAFLDYQQRLPAQNRDMRAIEIAQAYKKKLEAIRAPDEDGLKVRRRELIDAHFIR